MRHFSEVLVFFNLTADHVGAIGVNTLVSDLNLSIIFGCIYTCVGLTAQ